MKGEVRKRITRKGLRCSIPRPSPPADGAWSEDCPARGALGIVKGSRRLPKHTTSTGLEPLLTAAGEHAAAGGRPLPAL